MSHSYLDSTPSKLLAYHASTVGWLRIGKGLIQRKRKWKNKQREGKLPAAIGYVRLSVNRTHSVVNMTTTTTVYGSYDGQTPETTVETSYRSNYNSTSKGPCMFPFKVVIY